jgi:acyl carrier protein
VTVAPMSFERFVAMVIGRFGLPLDPIDDSTGLWDELGLDSFDALGLVILIEEAADVMYTPFDLPQLFCVGDAYRYYRTLMAAGAADAEVDA